MRPLDHPHVLVALPPPLPSCQEWSDVPGELPFKTKAVFFFFFPIFAVYAKSIWNTARATMPAIPIELVWVRQVPNAAVRFIPE